MSYDDSDLSPMSCDHCGERFSRSMDNADAWEKRGDSILLHPGYCAENWDIENPLQVCVKCGQDSYDLDGRCNTPGGIHLLALVEKEAA